MSNSIYALIAPFYPIEATKKGVSQNMIGVVVVFYSVAVIINSVLIGKVMNYVGRTFIT